MIIESCSGNIGPGIGTSPESPKRTLLGEHWSWDQVVPQEVRVSMNARLPVNAALTPPMKAPELASGDGYFPRYSRSQLNPPRRPAAGLPRERKSAVNEPATELSPRSSRGASSLRSQCSPPGSLTLAH